MADGRQSLRLIGTGAPDGQIGLQQLADLADALQSLATCIGRHVIEQPGPGRTFATAENVTRIRLVGLRDGSTTLDLDFGQPDVLPVDVDIETETRVRFEELIAASAASVRPSWVPDLVAESVGTVLDAFGKAASAVEFTPVSGPAVVVETHRADRDVWRSRTTGTTERLSATGFLEKVDLKAHSFRIRDDVGNAIRLERIDGDAAVGPLVGQRVVATGDAVLDSRGQLKGLTSPVIEPAPLPVDWIQGTESDWSGELAKPGPDAVPPVELTDEEFKSLTAVLQEL